MKISIITVVYNNEKTLQDAIDSISNQTYKNVEYIVIDGGSTDNTLEILKKNKSKINYLISEKDKGLYDAMNKGIRVSTGDVIGILNSDDLYQDENVIQDVMDQFINNSELDVLYGDLVYVKKEDTDKIVRNWTSCNYYLNYFDDGIVPPHPSLFVKKNVYLEIELFDLDFKLAADYELMFRILKKHSYNSKYINRLIVKMRLGGESNKNLRNIILQNKIQD